MIKNESNPVDAIKAGLAMQKWIENKNAERKLSNKNPWKIRIGIHSGPVAAGVIGRLKFVYDI